MTNGDELFLLLSEELNFHKAAKNAHISQQCLSDHIKRLENKYGTTLFYRKPKVTLTLAGEAVRRALQRVRLQEQRLLKELDEIEQGDNGNLTVGINSTRAPLLLPSLCSNYINLFPKVQLQFVIDDTKRMEEKLIKGELDCFIGINTELTPQYSIMPLSKDQIYVICTRSLFQKHHPDINLYNDTVLMDSISIHKFQHIPFVRNLSKSTLTLLVDQFVIQEDALIKTALSVSDHSTQIKLCASGAVAAFCPSMMLQNIFKYNETATDDPILIFPINGLDQHLRIDLVFHRGIHYPRYAKVFFEMIRSSVAQSISLLKQKYGVH